MIKPIMKKKNADVDAYSHQKNAFSVLLSASQNHHNYQNRKRSAASLGKVPPKRSSSNKARTYVPCPICTVQVQIENVSEHIDNNCKGAKKHNADQTETDAQEYTKLRRKVTSQTKITPEENEPRLSAGVQGTKGKAITSTAPNAFDQLMEAARILPRQEHFHLYQTNEGKLSWSWVVVQDGVSSSKTCSKEVPPTGAESPSWQCEVPIKESSIGSEPGKLVLTTSVPLCQKPCTLLQKNHRKLSRFSVSVLKSLLQKNVRRQRAESAVRVAYELMLKSWADFIRRMMIIMLEDSMLHPSAPLLVWLMVADSRGYSPSNLHVKACLSILYEISQCQWQDQYDLSVDLENPTSKDLDCLPFEVAGICRAVLCRMRYGGMSCDCALMKFFVWKWRERFLEDQGAIHATESNTDSDCKQLRPASQDPMWLGLLNKMYSWTPTLSLDWLYSNGPIIRKEDAISSGIDFHVSSILEVLLSKPEISEQIKQALKNSRLGNTSQQKMLSAMKRAMWECSGSINSRALFSVEQFQIVLTLRERNSSITSLNHQEKEIFPTSFADIDEESQILWSIIEAPSCLFQKHYITSHIV